MSDRLPFGCASQRRVRLGVLLLIAVAPAAEAQVQSPKAQVQSPEAQVQSPEAPPPEDIVSPPPVDQPIAGGRPVPGATEPRDSSTALAAQWRSPWGFLFRAGEGWVRNPGAIPGETAGSYAGRASFAADYLHTAERGMVRVSGDAVITRYHQYADLNNVGGGGSIKLGHTLSPRASFTLGDSLQTRYAYENALLTGSGVFLGPVRTLTNVASGALDYRLGSRTGLVIDARHEHVAFDSPTLNDGAQFAASANVTHRRSTYTGIAASYLFGVSSGAQRWTTHTGFGSWRQKIGPRWTSGLSLGATYSTRSGSTFPYAVAELGAVYARAFFSARFSNSVSQALGGGYEQEMTTFGLTARRPLARWLTASLAGSYADSRGITPRASASASGVTGSPAFDVGAQTPRYKTLQASGSLRVRLTSVLGLEADAFTMRLRPEAGAAPGAVTDTVTAGAGLAFVYETPNR